MDVAARLRQLRVPHEFEYLTEDGLFSIDLALQGPRGPLAIEVDGPYHFTINTQQPTGSTIIRCAADPVSPAQGCSRLLLVLHAALCGRQQMPCLKSR
jgi:hypothetical protein